MNSIRRAITAERKRILKLSPTSIIQHQHFSSYTPTKTTSRTLKSSKFKPPEVRSQPAQPQAPPPMTTRSSLNDAVLKEQVIWPKPSEIPWQSKVVNSVNLIGHVKIPVQFEASSDGKNYAGTIISQDEGAESSGSLPSFWIPVIFEGDLAHIAMCHLKEKDYVHVAGHLSVDVPPFKLSAVQANVQVMVHSISFVQNSPTKKISTHGVLDKWSTKNSVLENNVLPQKEVGRLHSDRKVDKQSIHALWGDLLTNSKQWLDNREKKRKGLVKANYPDFKHKDSGVGLWLDGAPVEILQGLGQLGFSGIPIRAEKDGDSWKHLVENPNNWWDNRLDKKNHKGPDFKNKDSGKGLWLRDAPTWASSSLPPLKAKTVDVDTKKAWGSY